MKYLKQRLLSLSLALSLIITMAGCKKDSKQEVSNQVGFLMESDYNNGSELYSYIIDRSGLSSQDFDFGEEKIFAKESDRVEYGTDITNDMTSRFFLENVLFITPDCYKHYSEKIFNNANFECELVKYDLFEYLGEHYKVIESKAVVKKDLRSALMVKNGAFLKKGDALSSIAIIHNDELVAFKQYGAGSECPNVVASQIGDPDIALKTVADEYHIIESETVSSDALSKMQEEQNIQLVLKKRRSRLI